MLSGFRFKSLFYINALPINDTTVSKVQKWKYANYLVFCAYAATFVRCLERKLDDYVATRHVTQSLLGPMQSS